VLKELSGILFQLSGIEPNIPDYPVHSETPSSVSPKEGTDLMPSFEPLYKGRIGRRKMRRLFLSGALCGVLITAAVTYLFAIPANTIYWQSEIWKRGGAAWTSDKNGHIGWKWMVEPIRDAPLQKRAIAPPSEIKVRSEQL
jgi:hypothetical protein